MSVPVPPSAPASVSVPTVSVPPSASVPAPATVTAAVLASRSLAPSVSVPPLTLTVVEPAAWLSATVPVLLMAAVPPSCASIVAPFWSV